MADRRRTGALRVFRASALSGGLTLAEFGLRDRLWLDLRWTPAVVVVGKQTFELKSGQAVISMAAYSEEFNCHRRVIAEALKRLVEAGWFAVESSPRGTVVTCLRDPRDGSDLNLRAKGGGCTHGGQPSFAEADGEVVPTVDNLGCPPVAQPHIVDAVVHHGGSTPGPNNGPGAAVGTALVLPEGACARASASPAVPGSQFPVASGSENRKPTTDDPDPPPPRGVRPHAVPATNNSLPPALAAAASQAGVPRGIVAQALLEGRPEALVLAWLVCAARKRAKLRSPAAFFRAMNQKPGTRNQEPPLCDQVEAKLQLRGDLGGPRAARFARECAALLPDADGQRPSDRWRILAELNAQMARARQPAPVSPVIVAERRSA